MSSTRETKIIIRHLVTSPFKPMYFQISCRNYSRITIEATVIKKVPNESKLIYAIYIFIVASWHLLFLYDILYYNALEDFPIVLNWNSKS